MMSSLVFLCSRIGFFRNTSPPSSVPLLCKQIHCCEWSPQSQLFHLQTTTMLLLNLGTQTCVNREYRMGVSTNPWGVPAVVVEDLWGTSLERNPGSSCRELRSGQGCEVTKFAADDSIEGRIIVNKKPPHMCSVSTWISTAWRAWEMAFCVDVFAL